MPRSQHSSLYQVPTAPKRSPLSHQHSSLLFPMCDQIPVHPSGAPPRAGLGILQFPTRKPLWTGHPGLPGGAQFLSSQPPWTGASPSVRLSWRHSLLYLFHPTLSSKPQSSRAKPWAGFHQLRDKKREVWEACGSSCGPWPPVDPKPEPPTSTTPP